MAIILLAACLPAADWVNVDAAHYLGGRKASSGYLQGKVVLVCTWEADDPESVAELLPALENIWSTFKTKQLVILGAPVGADDACEAVKRQIRDLRLGFPVYREAALAGGGCRSKPLPLLCVADETGKFVYIGSMPQNATQAVVTALTDLESPKDVEQWRRFLDYELVHLPCHAFLRLREFRKKFPDEVRAYAPRAKELSEIEGLKKVVNLIEFAKKAKDPPIFSPEEGAKKRKYQKLVTGVISNGETMKNHPDARVAREVKNALADLKWTQAEF